MLEVVTTNTAALNLYGKLGYSTVRELALLQSDGGINAPYAPPQNIDIRDIDEPNWAALTSCWDGHTSWQNSVDAVTRSRGVKRILGAFLDGKCIGYIVFSSKFGRAAQLSVSKDHRRRGIGTALVTAMQKETADGFSMQVINVDKSLTEAMSFLRNRGFYERLSQYEMIKPL